MNKKEHYYQVPVELSYKVLVNVKAGNIDDAKKAVHNIDIQDILDVYASESIDIVSIGEINKLSDDDCPVRAVFNVNGYEVY